MDIVGLGDVATSSEKWNVAVECISEKARVLYLDLYNFNLMKEDVKRSLTDLGQQ